MTADRALYIPPYKADDQDIVVELNARFGAETFTLQPSLTGMPVLWVPRERLLEVLGFLRQVAKPYVMLYDLHGVDERLRTHRQGLPDADFSVFYHLMSLERNSDVMIKVALKESDLSLPTATSVWPNANWYEREVWDMYGIDFRGHPHLARMLMPPTWEGHPLRKDYPARATEFDPYALNAAKQDLEQEALRFKPEDWGMQRHSEHGVNNIDLAAARAKGIMVSNTPGVFTEDTADMTMALILSVPRRLAEGEKLMRSGKWVGWAPSTMLGHRVGGKLLGIIGMAVGIWRIWAAGKQAGRDAERATNATQREKSLDRIKRAADARPSADIVSDPYNRDNA